MYLITYHSYGRQGCNESGPIDIFDTIEEARVKIAKEIAKEIGIKIEDIDK